MNFKTTLFIMSLLPNLVLAENVYDAQYQTIKEIEITKIVEDQSGTEVEIVVQKNKSAQFEDQFNQVQKVNIGEVIMVTKELIALGKEIYAIVEAGKPVVTLNSEPIEILPRDEAGNAITGMQLHGWKAPKAQKFRVSAKNYLGIKTASFEVMLIFSYGGQNNGSGRFITGAQIKPTKVDVKWGYNLDVDFKLQTIINEGTLESPIAGAVLMLDYKISTVLQNTQDNLTFYINGLGAIKNY